MNKVITALITPFQKDQSVDYEALKTIVLRQIKEGVDGFVVCGTTAEVATLTKEERYEILRFVLDLCKNQVEVWYGCGSNCTRSCVEEIKRTQDLNISGYLLVTPYYNKPSQRGIYEHYMECDRYSKHPIMLYVVPSRTAVMIEFETMCKILQDARCVQAIKYAHDDLAYIKKVKAKFPHVAIYNGVDELWKSSKECGMDGMVSVMSHLCVKQLKAKHPLAQNNRNYIDLLAQLCFIETSPAPIKYMLWKKGVCHNILRLPLVELSPHSKQLIDECLQNSTNDSFTL